MQGFPTLYTERLKLRKLQFEDYPLLVQYANNKKVSNYIINIPYPYREPDAAFRMSHIVQGFKNKTRIVFAIAMKENNAFVGEISLNFNPQNNIAELGYWIGEPLWNHGFASEAIHKILDYGFNTLKLALIFASTHIENLGSEKVLIKNGFIEYELKGKVKQFRINLKE